jgi:hypothetical protein
MVWRVSRDRGRRRPDGRDKRLRRIVCVEVAPGCEDATMATANEFRDATRSVSVGSGAKTLGRELFQRA